MRRARARASPGVPSSAHAHLAPRARALPRGSARRPQAIAGGALSDRLGERDGARRLWLPIGGSVAAALCWSAMLDASTFEWAMAFLLLQYLAAECWFGAAVATLQAQLPSEVQGGAQGLFSALTVVGNLSPLLIGQASQSRPLADVLNQVVPALYVGSAVAFALTCRQLGRPPKPGEQLLSGKQ